jgi:hypothetical protein
LADALPDEAEGAYLELQGADAGKLAGLEPDVPELAFPASDAAVHLRSHLQSAVAVLVWPAPDTRDAAQSAAQSCAEQPA